MNSITLHTVIFEDLANLSYDVGNPGQGGSPNVNWAVK